MTALPRPTLEGQRVRLVPLSMDHLPGLVTVGLSPDLWTWIPSPVTNAQEMEAFVRVALDGHERGEMIPFATTLRSDGRVVGSTRFGNIALDHRRLEIGWTWIAPEFQRTPVNTEAKLLMMAYAFEELGCQRVELKTDALNARSRAAILRIGAKEEGTFRKHMITSSGRVRDTVYFSITDEEWPEVKERLRAKLA